MPHKSVSRGVLRTLLQTGILGGAFRVPNVFNSPPCIESRYLGPWVADAENTHDLQARK